MVSSLIRVIRAHAIDGHRVSVVFSDNHRGIFDMAPWMGHNDVFAPLSTQSAFTTARSDGQTVIWLDGSIDIAPETVYEHTVFEN